MSKIFLSFIIVLILFVGCTKDAQPTEVPFTCDDTISFSNDILPIVDLTCAISGCHVGSFPWGNFTTYEGVTDKLNLFSFKVSTKSMPPPDSNGPTELTQEELDKIDCWINKGAMDN